MELAEQHKKGQIKARNREYQKLYYKLHKQEILKKKKKKREEARSDSDEAESRAAERYRKRRQYQREYYLKDRKCESAKLAMGNLKDALLSVGTVRN